MLKLWGRINSTNVRKALWCLEELEVPYTRIDAGGAFGVVGEAEYLAKNPNRLVPCLEDGDLVLWESNAIVRYLVAQYGAGTLWGADPRQRAGADKWMDWVTSRYAKRRVIRPGHGDIGAQWPQQPHRQALRNQHIARQDQALPGNGGLQRIMLLVVLAQFCVFQPGLAGCLAPGLPAAIVKL